MLTPIEPLSFKFVSDGISTQVQVDLRALPLGVDLTGVTPIGILQPTATSSALNTTPFTLQAVLTGTVVTFTASVAPDQIDGNGNPVIYNLSFYLEVVPGIYVPQSEGAGYGSIYGQEYGTT